MTSYKHLKGIAHDIAAHAASSMSWLHPSLSQACRANNVANVVLDLTHDPKFPEAFLVSKPLALATNGLKEWYRGLLKKKGFSEIDIQSVTIEFVFPPQRTDDYWCACRCRLVSSLGKEFVRIVNSLGREFVDNQSSTS
jgi:hypothetical protein